MGALDRSAKWRPQFAHGYLALLFVAVITLLIFGKDTSRHHEEGAYMPLVANNAASKLAASIGAADTQISLQAGTGSMFSDGAHTHSVSGTAASAGSHTHTITVSSKGSGDAHNNVQPTLVSNMIIKT